jgi:polyphosphate kinase 2
MTGSGSAAAMAVNVSLSSAVTSISLPAAVPVPRNANAPANRGAGLRRRREQVGSCHEDDMSKTETANKSHETTRSLTKDFKFDVRRLPKWIEEASIRSGGYPYDKKMKRKAYERELRLVQIELLKLLAWVKDRGERVVVVFEGRDAAGKGGVIARVTQHLNPRSVRVVALPKPTDVEARQWYFQRYVAHVPPRGEIALFDRSWYNRAGVERVFDFCSPGETEEFLREAPVFEAMLARDGVHIIKIFLSVGLEMQMKRLHARWHDPLKRWKLSEIDFKAIEKWDDYARAFERMLAATDSREAPWTVALANDKRRERLAVIRHILTTLPYKGKDEKAIGPLDRSILLTAAEFLSKGGEEER